MDQPREQLLPDAESADDIDVGVETPPVPRSAALRAWLALDGIGVVHVGADGLIDAVGHGLARRLGAASRWRGRPLFDLLAEEGIDTPDPASGEPVGAAAASRAWLERRLARLDLAGDAGADESARVRLRCEPPLTASARVTRYVHSDDGREAPVEGVSAGALILLELDDPGDDAVRTRYSVYVTLLQRVAVAANEAESAGEALQVAVNEVCAHTGWPLGHVYLADPGGSGEMVPTSVWYVADELFRPFVELTEKTRYAIETGLPGRVLRDRRAVWMSRDAGGPRAGTAEQVGIRWGAGFPVMIGDEVAAILEFFSDREMADDELLEVMEHVGDQLGRVLERQRTEAKLRQSTDDYRGLFEHAHDAIVILDGERETVVAANPSACRLYALDEAELVGRPLTALAADADATRQRLHEATDSDSLLFFEDVHQRSDGSRMDLEVNVSPVTYRGRPALLMINRDVSRRRSTERALRASEERYALAARAAADGLWDWDLTSGEVYYSPRWHSMLGLDPAACAPSTKSWFDLVHPEDSTRLQWELVHHIEGATDHFESEHRLMHADGEYRWVLSRGLAVRDDSGRAYRIAGSLSDITERKRAEQQLVHDALHDGLTGLPSRILFMDRLTRAINRCRRHPESQFAVLFLDLDEFKIVNESLGHQAGDQMLVEIGRRIAKSLRSTDTVARLGGDEFAILIEDTHGPDDGERIAENIHMLLQQPFQIGQRDVFASGSIGIALSSAGYERAEDLLRDADTAMYRAKSMGRSRHAVFDKEMHASALALLDLETALRKAVENEELALYYQPVVSFETGQLAGFEALVRWPRADGQLVPPLDFIPLAESSGLIVPLGLWVLREACERLAAWHAAFASTQLHISVNISPKQLWRDDFVDQVREVIEESGLPPSSLRLELTESLLMTNADAAGEVLTRLRGLGVGMCIDDFGTGYSSLSYLQRFPIDTIKIDRSFVSGMSRGESDMMIVRTIISLAHSLGLDLVAEGVETPEQQSRLRALGCELGQGYLFSRPLPVSEAEALIQQFPRW